MVREMTRLLVSVRGAGEARQAILGGAHIVDVKEPSRGPLGRPDGAQLSAVREEVQQQRPLSAACGELLDTADGPGAWPASDSALQGYEWAKVGLAGCAPLRDWPRRWEDFRDNLPSHVALVAVAYGDWWNAASPSPTEIIALAGRLGCPWLLIDTFDKSRGDLFQQLAEHELARWIAEAREVGLSLALAGSLTLASLPRALAYRPDVVAVRGAACGGNRNGSVSADCVRQIVEHLPWTSRAAG